MDTYFVADVLELSEVVRKYVKHYLVDNVLFVRPMSQPLPNLLQVGYDRHHLLQNGS